MGSSEKDEAKTEKKKMLQWIRRYAQRREYILNPIEEELQLIVEGLIKNQKVHGYRYCPCRIVSGDSREDRKKICPCFYHVKEIEEMGHCHCRLFWSKEYYEKWKSGGL